MTYQETAFIDNLSLRFQNKTKHPLPAEFCMFQTQKDNENRELYAVKHPWML